MVSNIIGEDCEDLLGDNFHELSGELQKKKIQQELKFEQFAPETTPKMGCSSEYYNPAISLYKESGLSYGQNGWEPVDNTKVLRKCPEYLPTGNAIDILSDMRLVEVGAGNGYWAHVINENGGDVVPTDIQPMLDLHVGEDDEPPTNIKWVDDDSYGFDGRIWADSKKYGGVQAAREFADRDVLMCHPSGATRWSVDVLDALDNQQLVFVGEWFPGADAHPLFFKRLTTEWDLVETFSVYDWASMHAWGYIFEPC